MAKAPKAKSWFKMKARADKASADIYIYDDIGDWGVSAAAFRDGLAELGDVSTLNLYVSSNGGDVSTGFAIINQLERHAARKIVTVDGLAASMASVIAMAGDEVRMPANAMMMIHNPWGAAIGESDSIIAFGEALAKMQDAIVSAYVGRSGMKASDVRAMMDRETWLSADEAVKYGLADVVLPSQQMAAACDISKFTKVPKRFGRAMESAMTKRRAEQHTDDNEDDNETVAVKTEDEIRDEILATHDKIRALCKLAGKPEMADKFIADKLNPDAVVAKLAELHDKKAAKDEKESTNARHDANDTATSGVAAIDPTKIYERYNSARKSATA